MPYPSPIAGRTHLDERRRATLTIPVGATTSDELELTRYVPLHVRTPSNLTGSILYVEERDTETGTWSRLSVDGADLAIQAPAGKTVPLPWHQLNGLVRIRFVADAAQSGADAVLTVLCGSYD